MAVDTAAKRFSMMTFGDGDHTLPRPDGTIAEGDRLHLLNLYSGIDVSGGTAAAAATDQGRVRILLL